MSLIRPFAGLRVRPDAADRVAAPPYDVMNAQEAAQLAAGKPDSFLHVSRPEIDLPPGTDPYADEVYDKAAENFRRLVDEGLLIRDPAPRYYLYRLTFRGRAQVGLCAEVLVDGYLDGRVKRHEFTRPDKEDDRTRHIEAVNANTGPVFLVYRQHAALQQAIEAWIRHHPADIDLDPGDGVRHEFWVVDEPAATRAIDTAAAELPALYIADGHHRSAAAARVTEARRAQGQTDPNAPHQAFFGVLFPDDQVRIYDYNRVVRDLGGLSAEQFLARLDEVLDVERRDKPVAPRNACQFGMYLGGQWYSLTLDPSQVDRDDPVECLDVRLLAKHVLEPILGIDDPRRDPRIDFVGGIRGLQELERRVDGGDAVAFSLHPTRLDELLAVADAGEVMPPKSTWFEPKLRDGLLSQVLD